MAGSPVWEVVFRGDKQKIQQVRQILGQARATRAEHLTDRIVSGQAPSSLGIETPKLSRIDSSFEDLRFYSRIVVGHSWTFFFA